MKMCVKELRKRICFKDEYRRLYNVYDHGSDYLMCTAAPKVYMILCFIPHP